MAAPHIELDLEASADFVTRMIDPRGQFRKPYEFPEIHEPGPRSSRRMPYFNDIHPDLVLARFVGLAQDLTVEEMEEPTIEGQTERYLQVSGSRTAYKAFGDKTYWLPVISNPYRALKKAAEGKRAPLAADMESLDPETAERLKQLYEEVSQGRTATALTKLEAAALVGREADRFDQLITGQILPQTTLEENAIAACKTEVLSLEKIAQEQIELARTKRSGVIFVSGNQLGDGVIYDATTP